jgi:hypothetical protein
MGKIRGNNPLFTTKLHFVENFVRTNTCKGYNDMCKGIDFIGIYRKNGLVGKSGNVENSSAVDFVPQSLRSFSVGIPRIKA